MCRHGGAASAKLPESEVPRGEVLQSPGVCLPAAPCLCATCPRRSCPQSPQELLDTVACSREPSPPRCMTVAFLLSVTENQSCSLWKGTMLISSKAAGWEVLAPVELRNQFCWILANLGTVRFWRVGPCGIHHLVLCTLNSSSSEGAVQCSRRRRKRGTAG